MLIARAALRTAKSLLSTVKPRYSCALQGLETQCRSVTTGRDHLRLGKDGDPLQFVGTYIEKSSTNDKPYYTAIGYSSKEYKFIAAIKTWLQYSCDGDLWTCRCGYTGAPDCSEFNFKPGKEFLLVPGSLPVKVVIDFVGDVMEEQHQHLMKPDYIINITRKVDGKKLKATYKFKDITMKKEYKRAKEEKDKKSSTTRSCFGGQED